MPKPRVPRSVFPAVNDEGSSDPIAKADFRRLIDLVALLLTKGEEQTEKVRLLSAVGYTAPEIALLLGTTANAIRLTRHRMKKGLG